MKNIKISDDLHRQIKEISTQEGITMDGVLRKLLQVEKADNQKAESAGSNTLQERNTTGSYSQVEKEAETQKGGWIIYDEEGNEKVKVSSKDIPLTEKKFSQFLEELRPFVKDFLKVKENMHFCPNCSHQLFLDTSHDHRGSGYLKSTEVDIYSSNRGWLKESDVSVYVYREKEYFELICPRCGYRVTLVKPKFWGYKDPDKKTVDLRNAEGRGEEQGEECEPCGEG